jgi:hypothetical protein
MDENVKDKPSENSITVPPLIITVFFNSILDNGLTFGVLEKGGNFTC